MDYYENEKIKLESNGTGGHVLAVTDVQHVIIVPAYKEDLSTLYEVGFTFVLNTNILSFNY